MSDESVWTRSETSGVPLWSTSAPRPATRAAIIIRAGIADETPETRGWLGVARDLALCVTPPDGITVAGSVRGLHTTIVVQSAPDRLAEGVRWAVGRLVKPDLDRLDDVIATRTAFARTPNIFGQLLRRELGAHGYGLAGFPEYGIPRLDTPTMRWFTSVVYTAENMALCFDGVPPEGLDLVVGSDERWAPPDRTVQTRPRPAVTEVTGTDVGLLGIVTEDRIADVLASVVADRTTRRLRQQRPNDPAARAHVSRLDDVRSAVLLTGSAVETPPSFIHGCLEAALGDVVRTGAMPHELDDLVADTRRKVSDPAHHFELLQRAALDDLLGLPPLTPADMLERAESVTPIEVAELAVRIQDRHLVGLPAGSNLDNPFDMPVDAPVMGRARREGAVAHPSVDASRPHAAAYVMPSLIHLREDESRGLDIPAADIVLLLAYGDGGRGVITRDGFEHAIEPTLYEQGPLLVRAVDSMVPADLRVSLPERAHVPQPQPVTKRTVWTSVRSRVAPIAATLPILPAKSPQFDASRRLNDGLG
ncbi:MAG TPA: hypothetical protein VFK68_04545 [Propionibacteriaceae bacterium]|nr:hypothetical protein [Propionibacteriaceae bacterium]